MKGRSAAAVDAPQIEDRDGVAGSAAACYRLEPVDRLSLRRVANPLDARTKIWWQADFDLAKPASDWTCAALFDRCRWESRLWDRGCARRRHV